MVLAPLSPVSARAWGRLLRLSLAPTAAADIAAGVAAGAGGWPRGAAPFALMLASLCVYHGGMALNDYADREDDRRGRSDRPIPSGRIGPRPALAAAASLLLLGPLAALLVSPASGAILGGVSILAAAYDLALRGPRIGPLLLSLCRGGNLAAGLVCGATMAGRELGGFLLVPVGLYGAYVFAVSRLARLEDAPEETRRRSRPAIHLAFAAICLAAAPLSAVLEERPGSLRIWAALGLAAAGGAGLVQAAQRRTAWTGEDVSRAAGMCLRRLLVFTAAVALAAGGEQGWIVAGAILLGYPLAYALRGVFPPS